jgi:hypothetical protein
LRIAEFIPATEGLCERFSYRIARHFAISGESHEGAPQTGAVLPVEALEPVLGRHQRILHHTATGHGSGPNV